MAASLARHLALVTCKEPLKGNLATHIRTALVEQGFGEVARDDVILLLAGENWDVACTAIERAAMERAVSDVDSSFEASFDARRGWAQLQVSVYLSNFVMVADFFPLAFAGKRRSTRRFLGPCCCQISFLLLSPRSIASGQEWSEPATVQYLQGL